MSSQLQIRQLLQRTEAALDETSRLYIASRAITSARDTEEVYREAVDHLSHSLLASQRDLEDQPLLRFAVWMAWPESRTDAPYLETAYLWDSASDTGTIPAETQRVPSQELPYGRLTAEADGAVYLPDVAAQRMRTKSWPGNRNCKPIFARNILAAAC
jgi:hypothetical protein